MTFSNAVSGIKFCIFSSKFHCLFPEVQFTITKHQFRQWLVIWKKDVCIGKTHTTSLQNKCRTADPDQQNLGPSGKLSVFIIYKFWQNCASVRQVSDLILNTVQRTSIQSTWSPVRIVKRCSLKWWRSSLWCHKVSQLQCYAEAEKLGHLAQWNQECLLNHFVCRGHDEYIFQDHQKFLINYKGLATEDLVTQGTRASGAMVLTEVILEYSGLKWVD